MRKRKKLIFSVLTLLMILAVSMPVCAATVAKIGKKSYSSLSAAVAAVKNGQTIAIQKNFTEKITTPQLVLSSGKKYTIDLKKHKVKITSIAWSSPAEDGLMVIKKGKVVIKNGTLSLNKSPYSLLQVGNQSGSKAQMDLQKVTIIGPTVINRGGTVTMKNVTYRDYLAGSDQLENKGKLTITGGSFQFTKSPGAGSWMSHAIRNSGTMTINSGTFKKGSGYQSLIFNESKLTIKKGTFDGEIYQWNGKYGYDHTKYGFSKALIKTVPSLTIKAGTFRNTKTASEYSTQGGCVLNLSGNASITGGKFYETKDHNCIYLIYQNSYATKVKISGATIKGCIRGSLSELTISSSSITAPNGYLAVRLAGFTKDKGKLTVTGSSITGYCGQNDVSTIQAMYNNEHGSASNKAVVTGTSLNEIRVSEYSCP